MDYHTAMPPKGQPYVTKRHYLVDAVFLAGLESDDAAQLQELEQVLKAPAFSLFLGRRCCPPTLPLCLGIRECGLCEALETEPSLTERRGNTNSRMVLDALPQDEGAAFLHDLPITFSPLHRKYGYRLARELPCTLPDAQVEETRHDPFTEFAC